MQTSTEQVKETVQQACPGMEKPQAEHQWLHKLIGEWTCEGEATPVPGQPPARWTCTEAVRSLGGMWVVGESHGEMPGGGASHMMITFGFDLKKRRYVGTFVGSMMSSMWVYEGTLDAAGRVLTLDTHGPAMSGDGSAKYQDIVEFKNDDERSLTSLIEGPNGEWQQIMKATYRRKK
jgi:hypothetical protein